MSVNVCGIETKNASHIEGLCRNFAKSVLSSGLLVVLKPRDSDSTQDAMGPKTSHNPGSDYLLDTKNREQDLTISMGDSYREALPDEIDIREVVEAMLRKYDSLALEKFLDEASDFIYTQNDAGTAQIFVLERIGSLLCVSSYQTRSKSFSQRLRD